MKEATNVSEEDFVEIKKEVKAFLSRDNLQCHFVKRPCKYEACMDTHRLIKRKASKQMSYGRYDVRENIVAMISENLAEPAVRSDAFRYWLGHELAAYKRELEGISTKPPGEESSEDVEHMFAAMLGSGVSDQEVNRGTTDKEYAVGEWCKANMTKDVAGVSLKVSNVTLNKDEIYSIYIGLLQVQIIVEEEAEAQNTTPKSINYGKGLRVSPNTKRGVRNNEIAFEEGLVNTNPGATHFLDRLNAILAKPKIDQPTSITCLFHGAPGTSKTALAEHLAAELDLRLIKRSYADIQDKYIGEGEKKLAQLFREAQGSRNILLLDEIDSLAMNRATTNKEYSRTMTNQLLTSLDEFEGIVICTTNFIKLLDPAVIRRFYLKMEFSFLTHDQQKLAFKKFFKSRFRNKQIPNIEMLTTGDFKVVKERSLYEPDLPDFDRVVQMLRDEVKLKIETTPELKELLKRPIGFH